MIVGMRSKLQSRKGRPLNLQVSLAHDIVDNPAEYAERQVNPTIRVVRTLRNDPIAAMRARGKISAQEYDAAREWQRLNELAGVHIKSSGYLEEPVDGSRPPAVGITDAQLDAHERLLHVARKLGPRQHQLLVLVLDRGLSAWGATAAMFPNDLSNRRRDMVALWFQEILSTMASALLTDSKLRAYK